MTSLKTNAIANSLLKILNIVFPLITTPYLTRLLNENDYADFNSANAYMNLFVPLAAFGIYNYGIRELSNIKTDKTMVNKIFSKLFYTGIITSIITTLIYIIIIMNKNNIRYEIYYILGFQILSQFLYVEWVNEALENYSFILYKTLLIRTIMLISIFLFVRKPEDVVPYAIITSIITFINFLVSFVWIKRDIKLVSVSIRDIFKTLYILIPVFLLANVNMLYTVIDRLFLTYSKVNTDITYYTLAQTITTIITGVLYGTIGVNIPRYGYYIGINRRDKYIKLLNISSRYFLAFIIPISFGFIILGQYIMFVSFGNKYYDSFILNIFGIRTIFWAIEAILGYHIIFTNGYEKILTGIYFVGGVVNLLLNSTLLFLDIINPEFLLFATIIAEVLVIILEIIFIKKQKILDISHFLKNSLKYILVSAIFIPIFMIIKNLYVVEFILNIKLILFIIIIVLSCATIYTIILLIVKDATILEIKNFAKKKFLNSQTK